MCACVCVCEYWVWVCICVCPCDWVHVSVHVGALRCLCVCSLCVSVNLWCMSMRLNEQHVSKLGRHLWEWCGCILCACPCGCMWGVCFTCMWLCVCTCEWDYTDGCVCSQPPAGLTPRHGPCAMSGAGRLRWAVLIPCCEAPSQVRVYTLASPMGCWPSGSALEMSQQSLLFWKSSNFNEFICFPCILTLKSFEYVLVKSAAIRIRWK